MGCFICQKGYRTNAIRQNSRGVSLSQYYKMVLAIRRPLKFMKFKDMTGYKAGSGFIWKRGRKVLRWSAEGAGAQAGQRNCPDE